MKVLPNFCADHGARLFSAGYTARHPPYTALVVAPVAADDGAPLGEGTAMPLPLLPTSLVGSYAQPDWLIDRKKLAGRFPPRVRAKELWRVSPEYLEQAQDDAT